MQALLKTLKDSGIDDYAATIVKNTEDIAANASIIAKNSEDIQSNAAAIAKNAEDIAALQTKLGSTKTELVEAYTAAIAKAISDYDGTITSKLATDISKVEEKVQACRDDITALTSKIAALEDKVTALEGVVSQIASISYIPRYADGAERVEYTRNALDIIPGAVTLRFDVHPASAAAEIAANWESLLSARAVYTLTKAGAGDFIDLSVTGATAENGVLAVTVATDALNNKEFILENLSASVVVKVSSELKNIVSDYAKMIPASYEIKFLKYLVDYFDTDGDGVLNSDAVETAKELKVSGMNISTLEGVLERMPNLEVLDCSKNQLTNIDVSKNTNLLELDVKDNQLKELDVRNCGDLRFSDFSENDKSITVEQKGMLLADQRWSIFNVGAYSTVDAGKLFDWNIAKTQCPEGWKLPTKEELEALSKNYSISYSYKGAAGKWFSGGRTYSNSAPAIFLPATHTTTSPLNICTYYWSSQLSDSSRAYYLYTRVNSSDPPYISTSSLNSNMGVRCVKKQ